MQNSLDFDFEDFKRKARFNHFHGEIYMKFTDGELKLIRVEQTFQIKDFDKIVEISRSMI